MDSEGLVWGTRLERLRSSLGEGREVPLGVIPLPPVHARLARLGRPWVGVEQELDGHDLFGPRVERYRPVSLRYQRFYFALIQSGQQCPREWNVEAEAWLKRLIGYVVAADDQAILGLGPLDGTNHKAPRRDRQKGMGRSEPPFVQV